MEAFFFAKTVTKTLVLWLKTHQVINKTTERTSGRRTLHFSKGSTSILLKPFFFYNYTWAFVIIFEANKDKPTHTHAHTPVCWSDWRFKDLLWFLFSCSQDHSSWATKRNENIEMENFFFFFFIWLQWKPQLCSTWEPARQNPGQMKSKVCVCKSEPSDIIWKLSTALSHLRGLFNGTNGA